MVTTHIWCDSYNAGNFPAIKTMIVQTCNILQGNSRWTFQAHSLIFRECNTDAIFRKPILYNSFLLYCHPLQESHIFLFILYTILPMSNPLQSLIYENIKSHFIYWLLRRNKFHTNKGLSQKYQHALNVWTDFFAFFGSGGDRLFHWRLIFGFHITKVRPRFISLISKAVFPPESEAELNENVLLLQITSYKIMDQAEHAQQCWEATL